MRECMYLCEQKLALSQWFKHDQSNSLSPRLALKWRPLNACSPSPGELSKLCHLDLYASLRRGAAQRVATIRLRVHYYTFTRATVARNASGCRCFATSLFPPLPRPSHIPAFPPHLSSFSTGSVLAREFRTPLPDPWHG